MVTMSFLLVLLAFVAFAAAAAGLSSRSNLVAAGLALWVLSILLGRTVLS